MISSTVFDTKPGDMHSAHWVDYDEVKKNVKELNLNYSVTLLFVLLHRGIMICTANVIA